MVVQSNQWPIFLYLNGAYNPERLLEGLLHGCLLVNVSYSLSALCNLAYW